MVLALKSRSTIKGNDSIRLQKESLSN